MYICACMHLKTKIKKLKRDDLIISKAEAAESGQCVMTANILKLLFCSEIFFLFNYYFCTFLYDLLLQLLCFHFHLLNVCNGNTLTTCIHKRTYTHVKYIQKRA